MRKAIIPPAAGLLAAVLLAAGCAPAGPTPADVSAENGRHGLRHEIRPEPIPGTGRLEVDAARLPRDVRGKFPAFDGDNFVVNLPPRTTDALSSSEVFDQTVAPLLRAMGYGERIGEITLAAAHPRGQPLPPANLSELAQETCAEVRDERYQRLHPVCQAMIEGRSNPAAERAFQLAYGMTFAQFRAELERPRIQYVFAQRVDGVPIDHVAVVAARWEGETVTSVHGTVLNRYRVTNTPALAAGEAVSEGSARLLGMGGLAPVVPRLPEEPPAPELVLLPYGAAEDAGGLQVIALRYAWRTLLFAWPADGPQRPGHLLSWLAWIDAADGTLLSLLPQFNNTMAEGVSWRRDPNTPTQPRAFHVNGASGGQYVLGYSGVFNRFDRMGDGDFEDGEVSIPSTTGGSSALFANFNQAPLNQAAGAACSGGSNAAFRQVNAFAHLFSFRKILVNAGTFPPFPESPVTVWIDTPNGSGNSASYDAFGKGKSLLLFIPGANFAPATCPDSAGAVLPGSTDPTSMAHEFAHLSTPRLQYRRPADWCGMAPCPMPSGFDAGTFHDFADAMAHAYASTPCQAGWSRKNTGGVDKGENCATHAEDGWLPRLASVNEPFFTNSVLDHFPEKRATYLGSYEDGQIAAAALWLTRQGMRSKSLPSGTAQYWVRLNRALYDFGFVSSVCYDCDRGTYRYAQNMLRQMAQQWATAGQPGGPPGSTHDGAHTTSKLFSGWARAGIFLIPDVCIDGNAATGELTTCSIASGGEMGGDAVIDVWDNDESDDYVIDQIAHPEVDYSRRGGPPPSFRVWTGPRYLFDANGKASSFTPSAATPSPCHTRFQVELSTSQTFTSMVTSGWRNVSVTSQPECYGTWTPSTATWISLSGVSGDVPVYYRVRTRDRGGNERISTSPGSGSYTVPPAYVIVSDDGQP